MKLYRIGQSILDPNLVREWNINGRPVYTVDGIEYMPPKQLGTDIMYSIPISAIEEGWKRDKDFYFGAGEEDVYGRRARFREWRKKNIPIEAPEIYIDSKGIVYFTNGRHRFAELRDEGKTHIAVAVSKDSDKTMLNNMGAIIL